MPGHLCRQLGVQLLHLVMIRIARIPTFTVFTVLFSTFFNPARKSKVYFCEVHPSFKLCEFFLFNPGIRCQTRLRWETTTATAGCSATATLGRSQTIFCRRKKEEKLFVQLRFAKPVSRGLLAEPMWTIACENSFLDPLVELDITCSFTLSFPVD